MIGDTTIAFLRKIRNEKVDKKELQEAIFEISLMQNDIEYWLKNDIALRKVISKLKQELDNE